MRFLFKKRFSPLQVILLLVVTFLGVATFGYAIQYQHDFSTMAGEIISGSQVMDNFNDLNVAVESNTSAVTSLNTAVTNNTGAISSLNAALPIMAASIDSTDGVETCTGCPLTEVNSVTMDIPADGFLVINGSCFINNAQAVDMIFAAIPRLDGTAIQPTFAAAFESEGDTQGPTEMFTLAYTVAAQVSQGVHTISQDVGPSDNPQTFQYNRNNLTVVFYPAGNGSLKTQPVAVAAQSSADDALFGN